MNLELIDRVILLAGGAGSIGQATRETLLGEGAVPVVADRPASPAGDATAGAPARDIDLDVTDAASVASAVEQVLARHGRIDGLVTLAGIYDGTPAAELTLEQWDRVLQVNLRGTFLLAQAVLPTMQQASFGRIVAIASLAGQVGGIVAAANYAASKGGVLALVKSLARQVTDPRITINAVSPGPVDGAMTGAWPAEQQAELRQKMRGGRFARPEEIADLIAFLLSPRAESIHGARLDINGGIFMG